MSSRSHFKLALGLPIDETNKAEILAYLQESLRLSEELGFEDAIARATLTSAPITV